MPSIGLRLIIGLLTVFVVGQPLFAGGSLIQDEAVSLFDKGRRLLREGNWYHAAKVFEQLAGRDSKSENLDQYIFYRAKAKYYLGEFGEAIAGFNYFLSRFGDSREVPYVHFFLGNAYYRVGDVNQALESYLESYRLTDDRQLNLLVTASLTAVFENASSINLGTTDFAAFPDKKRRSLIKLLADILVDRGAIDQAEELLSSYGEELDLSRISNDQLGHRKEGIEVAVVLPFSGELHSFGGDIYDGAVIAAELYRAEEVDNLILAPYDTKGDPISAARIIAGLSESQTDAAIGPLTSEEAAVVSARLSCSSLPLLIPAATQAGLTQLSETSFQLSPNIELQGVKMAEYAANNLQADSVVIISSTSTDHLQMVRGFAERFQQLGGTVVAVEYYRSRDKDFGPHIRDVKAILLGLHPDSIFFINENGDTLDPDAIPAYIECLFLPGNPEQLRLLLPQINFYNLNGAYLGSDGWGDEVILKLGDDITKGAVFPSPFLTGAGSEEYVRFAAAYDVRYGCQPSRLAALGYDAVRLLTRTLRFGDKSKSVVVGELKKVQNYHGASGKITFGENRENVEMPLFRIVSEQAVPILSIEESTDDEKSR